MNADVILSHMATHPNCYNSQSVFRDSIMHIWRPLVVAIVLCFYVCNGESFGDGVIGKIKSGFEMAGKMLGLDRASGVAQLVSEAFGKTAKKGDADDHRNTIFSGFLRILGLDTKRIGALAVNAIIFMAQLISKSLSKPPPAYLSEAKTLTGTPVDWLMENPEVHKIISYAKNENLPHEIIHFIKRDGQQEQSGCLQLLICKSAPFVYGMQKAINAKKGEMKRGKGVLTQYLPSVEEVADHGDECELKYPYCPMHY